MFTLAAHTPPPPYQFTLFFFNDTAPTEIYTLSLHDALPICEAVQRRFLYPLRYRDRRPDHQDIRWEFAQTPGVGGDRKSTRLNSSHPSISYAVFCLKKKNRNAWCIGQFRKEVIGRITHQPLR